MVTMPRPWTGKRFAPFWVQYALPLLVISLLTIMTWGHRVLAADVTFTLAVQRLNNSALDVVIRYGNWAGSTIGGMLFVAPMVVWLLHRRYRLEAALIVMVLIVRAANYGLKWLSDSPRPSPDIVRVTEFPAGLGFPSGHSMSSVLVYGAVIIVVFRLTTSWYWRWFAVIGGVGSILATGLARIYVGAHWPSDVAGGYLWGAVLLSLLLLLVQFFANRRLDVSA